MTSPHRYDLYGASFKRGAYETYARMRHEDPVCRHPGITGRTSIWFITCYDDAVAILLDSRRFVKSPPEHRPASSAEDGARSAPDSMRPLLHHLLNLDPPEHTRLRNLIHRAFTPRMVERRRELVQGLADALIDAVIDTGRMNVIDDYAFPLTTGVILGILGIPVSDRTSLRQWSSVFVLPLSWIETSELSQEFTGYLEDLIAERRRQPGDDLISSLLEASDDGERLSHIELIGMLALLIAAGFETTTYTIGNTVLALVDNPDTMAVLRDHPERTAEAIEELMRYDGSGERASVRWAAEDVELGGHSICRGDPVIVVVAGANRDPDQFADPDRLDIARESVRHLGFGLGIHYCVGAPLARMEIEIALNTLLRRLPNLHLAVPRSDLRWNLTPNLRGLKALPIAWD